MLTLKIKIFPMQIEKKVYNFLFNIRGKAC